METMLPKQLLGKVSGFPEFGPAEAIAQQRVLDAIRRHYERAGYVPIETPLVERPEVLQRKSSGEMKKQIYGLRLLNPAPDAEDDTKSLGLRFDLTVPLARYVAGQYGKGEIQFPFRRYAIGPVFRGERPNELKDRFRQFIQADIDVIGDGALSLTHDSEMVRIIVDVFDDPTIHVGDFTVRINNRKVLIGFLRSIGCDTEEKVQAARAAVDDVLKVGMLATVSALKDLGVSEQNARDLLEALTVQKPNDEMLAFLVSQEAGFDDEYRSGIADLRTVVDGIRAYGVAENRFRVDPSLARGLDYYTGTVYEAHLNAHPDISIAGGGRYDNLVEYFSPRHMPGVGISIGVTRLVSKLLKGGLLPKRDLTLAPVLVTTEAGAPSREYLNMAVRLRDAGIPTEVYLEERPLAKQLQFANRRGFRLAIIARPENLASQTLIVRNLKTFEQVEIPNEELVKTVLALL